MQFAGQIWGHNPQATHLARPCSSVSMRWVPRQRGESVQSLLLFSSGYCIVTFGRHKWLKVSAMPLSVARRQDAWVPGRFMTFTPMAMSARLLSHCALHQMAPIEQEEQRTGEQHVPPAQRRPEVA